MFIVILQFTINMIKIGTEKMKPPSSRSFN